MQKFSDVRERKVHRSDTEIEVSESLMATLPWLPPRAQPHGARAASSTDGAQQEPERIQRRQIQRCDRAARLMLPLDAKRIVGSASCPALQSRVL